MSTHKSIDIICVAAIVLALVITVLFANGEKLGIEATVPESTNEYFTENDIDSSWDTSSATKITLNGNTATVQGNGAYINNGNVYIVYAGKYVVSGELTDGSIIINADGDDKIWLGLDGVKLYREDSAAILIEQADKVFLTLFDGTENSISSGKEYNSADSDSGVDGVIYSRDDLTINGSGKLNVTSNYCHAIVCNDDLAITSGEIIVEAVEDGIHANDSVKIKNTSITVNAGDDGITVSNDDNTAYFYMESGKVNIPSCYEGIEAASINVTGGEIEILPSDDGLNASGGSSSEINISGGNIRVINKNGRDADGFDSNGNIFISGGNVFISVSGNGGSCALDYGSESGGQCVIDGGTVIACGGSSMAEGVATSSKQGFIISNINGEADSKLTITDSNSNVLIEETIPCEFSLVTVSCKEITNSESYNVKAGANETQATAGEFTGNMGFGGNKGTMDMRGGNFALEDENSYNTHQKMFENSTDGEMPTPPDMQNGEMQGFKGGGQRGQMPSNSDGEMANPPELPSGEAPSEIPNGENGEIDSFHELPNEDIAEAEGQIQHWNNQNNDKQNMRGQMQTAEEESKDMSETFFLIGISLIVGVLGLAFAVFYKKEKNV